MTSPISKRTPPQRNFDDYVLTLSRGPNAGMTSIPQNKFTQLPIVGKELVTFDLMSPVIDIGFNFLFNKKVFKQIVVGTNGFIVLVNPALGAFNATDIFSTPYGLCTSINLTFNGHVLLAPLLCSNFIDVSLTQGAIASTLSNLTTQQAYNTSHGIEIPIKELFNPTAYACSNCVATTKYGRAQIVRWNNSNNSGRLTYEVALYENGTIEFNYAPMSPISNTYIDDIATIGIFLSNINFRDFASELQPIKRLMNDNGGAKFDQTFFDTFTGTNYASSLRTLSVYNQFQDNTPTNFFNWPTQDNNGATFTFQPPMLRRKVLPRKDIKNIDTQVNKNTVYDDRISVTFGSNVIVNYPTTLQRNFDSHREINVREQNLFSSNFLVTSSISRNASEQFLTSNTEFTDDPFFDKSVLHLSGSSVDLFGYSLKQPIEDKTRIDITLKVNYNTQLLPLTSCLYYYNNVTKCWNIPQNSVADLTGPASYDKFQATSYYVPEDFRGFGPVSNLISSGTKITSKIDTYWPYFELQSDELIAEKYTQENFANAIGKKYQKSVNFNADYEATDETFSIDIDKPFVLERAIISMPCAMGDSWFKQKTTTFTPADETNNSGNQLNVSFVDFVGPALTCALFNQIKTKNSTRRELICTGSIIPVGDNTSELVFSSDPGLTNASPNEQFNVRPEGFLAYSSNPAAVISPNNHSTFTGSVNISCDAAVTNGVILNTSWLLTDASQETQNRNTVSAIISTPSLPQNDQTRIYSILPLGRSSSGIEQSGRSVFGKEYGTFDNTFEIVNPFYLKTPNTHQQYVIDNGKAFLLSANIPLTKTTQSPYLLYPGDKLVFSVSKTRPKFYGNLWLLASGSAISGSSNVSSNIANRFDDVQLLSGTINITLYGSYIKNNKEINKITNYSTQIVNDITCNEQIIDKFETMNRDEYVGTITDRYLSGSIVRLANSTNKSSQFIFGNRALETSIYNSENQPNSDTHSKSFNVQPIFERTPKNSSRLFILRDYNERYYDSLLPDISKCIKLDNAFLYTTAVLNNFIVFDASIDSSVDRIWTKAFPFEKRYATAKRLQSISNGFTTTIIQHGITFSVIPEKNISGFFIIQTATNIISGSSDIIACDFDTNNPSEAIYMNNDDYAKILYGFGDANTCVVNGGQILGTNHFPNFRYNQFNTYVTSPVIRGSKYGVHNVLPEYTKMYCSRTHHGFLRDVYEQRLYGKLFNSQNATTNSGCVTVKFIDTTGNVTQPELTIRQNLSLECTSSIPYIDNVATDR